MTCVVLVRLSRGLRAARRLSKCAGKPRARLVRWCVEFITSASSTSKQGAARGARIQATPGIEPGAAWQPAAG
jgi:hypothetical protein